MFKTIQYKYLPTKNERIDILSLFRNIGQTVPSKQKIKLN